MSQRATHMVSVRVPEDTHTALKAGAEAWGVSVTGLVNTGLQLFMFAQAEVLLRSGDPDVIAQLQEGETVEAALASLEESRAALLASTFRTREQRETARRAFGLRP